MKVNDFISAVSLDENIHIVKCDESVWFGTGREAFNLDKKIWNARIVYISTSFCGIVVEITFDD